MKILRGALPRIVTRELGSGISVFFAVSVISVALASMTGCGRPIYNVFNVPTSPPQPALEEVLQVETTLTIFSGILSVRNVGEEPITIRKVVINDEYAAEHWITSMGGRGAVFEPTRIEMGKGVMLFLSPEWPRPIKVSVETDRGTLVSKLKYNN